MRSSAGDVSADAQARLDALNNEKYDSSLRNEARLVEPVNAVGIRTRRRLSGHVSKVMDCCWSGDSRSVLSVGLDGLLLLWNGLSARKTALISVPFAYQLSCAATVDMRLVACGGLDNVVRVYAPAKARTAGAGAKGGSAGATQGVPHTPPLVEHSEHTGFVSAMRFLGAPLPGSQHAQQHHHQHLLASVGGDGALVVFDVQKSVVTDDVVAHEAEAMCMDTHSARGVIFTGGADRYARVFDTRTLGLGPVQQFGTHTADVHALRAFPDGYALVTGCDDGALQLWDTRTIARPLAVFAGATARGAGGGAWASPPAPEQHVDACSPVTSVALSHSGRMLFSAHENGDLLVWDVVKQRLISSLTGHAERVSAVCVAPDGFAVLTASWDATLRVWA